MGGLSPLVGVLKNELVIFISWSAAHVSKRTLLSLTVFLPYFPNRKILELGEYGRRTFNDNGMRL